MAGIDGESARMNGPFDNWSDADVVDLIAANPLAWVVSVHGAFAATPLPLLVEQDEAGRPVSLLGHFARANPQVEQLRAAPRAWFLFSGPQGYVSPNLLDNRDWAPTWNYAVVRIEAELAFDEGLNDEALGRLVEAMEAGRPRPWTIAELGDRYDRLKQGIIAFRARIATIEPRFKLGQDERPEVFAQIVSGLADAPLVDAMRRFNSGRS